MAQSNSPSATKSQPRPLSVNINLDTTPILFTDNISMTTNPDGVVLNIMQRLAPTQARIVARVGMSREHAQKFVTELGRLLALTAGSGETSQKPKN